jgi:hypothetical protein
MRAFLLAFFEGIAEHQVPGVGIPVLDVSLRPFPRANQFF